MLISFKRLLLKGTVLSTVQAGIPPWLILRKLIEISFESFSASVNPVSAIIKLDSPFLAM